MTSKKKKIKAAGRFGAGYGTRARQRLNSIESIQRKKQESPFIKGGRVKRIAAGIWKCVKTGKTFAGPAYTLKQTDLKTKNLKIKYGKIQMFQMWEISNQQNLRKKIYLCFLWIKNIL